jgi:hypothetical protein
MAINGCDTLRPQDMYFRPFTNSVRDTKFHNDVGGEGEPRFVGPSDILNYARILISIVLELKTY